MSVIISYYVLCKIIDNLSREDYNPNKVRLNAYDILVVRRDQCTNIVAASVRFGTVA